MDGARANQPAAGHPYPRPWRLVPPDLTMGPPAAAQVDKDIINRLAHAHEQDKLPPGAKVALSVQGGVVHLDVTAPSKSTGSWFG